MTDGQQDERVVNLTQEEFEKLVKENKGGLTPMTPEQLKEHKSLKRNAFWKDSVCVLSMIASFGMIAYYWYYIIQQMNGDIPLEYHQLAIYFISFVGLVFTLGNIFINITFPFLYSKELKDDGVMSGKKKQ